MIIEPVILFFLLGIAAGLLRSDLKLPAALYETLSIFLLLAIGLKGGVELAKHRVTELLIPSLIVVVTGALLPLTAYPVLRRLGRLKRADAASIAAHYGSVSVVTFAVAVTYLGHQQQPYEGYVTLFLVLLEMPALVTGVFLAKGLASPAEDAAPQWGRLMREVFFGKSIFLLLGGLFIGWYAGPAHIAPLDRLFFDLFKGVLALFLLEMGLVASGRIAELKRFGLFLIGFATVFPLLAGLFGAAIGRMMGLSVGGTALLATLYASASYIAAPAAMRIAVPEANPALSIGASLGVTFPFNLLLGIPVYYWIALKLHGG
ncbi:sodium-dependent bicarbonate transport family permease [Pelomicrobium methylotrophicum]|uniref:Sodium-dependent bicarbonate transport family permease n=1 Tax=Pelomicrobium methylotrophicum TaxID=2602750 RepID=A0A5C7EUX2_9PROT|nr:sodium-dependent bicarbonate transport family permease [Pelomicrobium methylotrophicum]TXF12607.1 sodium-dependent bicarbonate transport family permease [Pelomicrobium methylotrophicum]